MNNMEQLAHVAKSTEASAEGLRKAAATAEDLMESRAREIAREHGCDMSRAYALAASDPTYSKAYALSIELRQRAVDRMNNVEATLGRVIGQ